MVLGLGLAAPAGADATESYKAALEAIDNREWAAAARHLQGAIAEEPKEKRRVRLYGMVFVEYLPHLHLGRAYLELGDCERALEELELSRRQGVVESVGKLEELESYRRRCRQAPDRPDPPVAAPPAAGPGTSEATEPAAPPVEEADIAGLVSPRASPPVPPASERVVPIETSLGGAPASGDGGGGAGIPAAAPPAAAEAARSRNVPSPLREAARAYFAGRYQPSLDQLAALRSIDPAVLAQAKLFEAAAHFALHRRSGEEGSGHLEAARAAARACRRLDRDLAPDPAVFSPAFLDLFRAATR